MKKIMLPLLLAALEGIQQPVSAQNDSAALHFPRFSLPEQSVQSFTVTGEQLSRMPYTDLGQAIGVWTGAGLATGNNTVFVVDGTLVNDVNIYSIQDIAMVTFVQTGPAQLAGMTRALQHLVLITTKRNTTGKWQWRVAGATAFVNRKDSAAKPGLYHQYNVSVSNGTEKLNYGASAGYIHDVFPQTEFNGNSRNTLQQNRYRANAFVEAGLRLHRLRLDAAYVTQRHSVGNTMTWGNGYSQRHDLLNKDHVLNLKASVGSTLGAGFTNRLIADFYDQHFDGNESMINVEGYGSETRPVTRLRNWMVGERFCFQYRKGVHTLTATLDARYRHIDYSSAAATLLFAPGYPPGNTIYAEWARGKNLYITPSADWSVNGVLNLQAGVLYSALNDQGQKKRFYPFASASFDLLQSINRNSPVSLRMYASVAGVTDFLETGWVKLANPGKQINLLDEGGIMPGGSYYNPFMVFDYSNYTRFQGGVRLGVLQNRVLADYSYDKSNVPAIVQIYRPGGGIGWVNTVSPYIRHRVAVSVKTDVGKLSCTSVLSVNRMRYRPQLRASTYGAMIGGNDFFTTAGFANRLTCNNWFSALDFAGVFNKAVDLEKRNAIMLQEIHLGKKFTRKSNAFEVYAFARTPFNNVNLPLADLRRYYGVGCTAAF